MSRQHRPVRQVWIDYLKVAPVPAVIILAHLAGGAGGVAEAGMVTAIISVIGGLAFASRRLYPSRAYVAGLRLPAIGLGVVLALGLISVLPGSDRLSTGWIAELAGLSTLSVDPEATWLEVLKILGLLTVFVLAQRYASSPERMVFTLQIMVWTTVGWAAWSLALFAMAPTGHAPIARLAGTFVSPNVAACVLSVGILSWMTLASMKSAKSGTASRLVMIGAGIVLAGALLLTASRSAIILLSILSACLWTPAMWRALKTRLSGVGAPLTGAILGTAGLVIVVSGAGAFMVRMGGIGQEVASRLTIMGAYAEAVSANPLFGQGLGTVPRISRLLLSAENDAVMWNVRAVHNLPLQWLVEAGFVGTVAAGSGLIALMVVTVRRLTHRDRRRLAPLLLVSAFMFGQGLVDYPAQIYSVALSWAFVLGLTYAWASVTAEQPSSGRRGGSSSSSPDEVEDASVPLVRRPGLDDTASPAARP